MEQFRSNGNDEIEYFESDIVLVDPIKTEIVHQESEARLQMRKNLEIIIDSLLNQKNELITEIEALKEQKELALDDIERLEDQDTLVNRQRGEPDQTVSQTQSTAQLVADNGEHESQFSERVKSLLNLEEEELAPILKQLDDQQLLRLYDTAGNIQREKMLRSLAPGRAANLMQKIML